MSRSSSSFASRDLMSLLIGLDDSHIVETGFSFSQTHLSEGCVTVVGLLGDSEGYLPLLLYQEYWQFCLWMLGKDQEGRFLSTGEESAF